MPAWGTAHELRQASFQQLLNYQFICRGTGVEWPELDYHLNIESMMVAKSQPQAA